MKMTVGDMALSLNLEIGALRRDGIDEKKVSALETHVTRVAVIVDEFGKAVEAARNSLKYTQSGLREFIDQGGAKARAEIATVAARVDYAARIQETKKKLAAVPLRRPKLEEKITTSGEKILLADPLPAENPILELLKQQEIRALMRGRDRLENWADYQVAIADDDWITIEAVEGAPKSFPILNSEQIADGVRLRQRKNAPVLAKQLDDLERLDAVWSGALKMAESCLEAEGVPPVIDAIAEAAKAA